MNSVQICGREFRLSALTLGELRELEPVLFGVEQKASEGLAPMLNLVRVIHASISKQHPEVELEHLEQLLDLNSFTNVLDRVLEVSGLRRQSSEAAKLRSSEAVLGESRPAAK
jgi:hypothetical protein